MGSTFLQTLTLEWHLMSHCYEPIPHRKGHPFFKGRVPSKCIKWTETKDSLFPLKSTQGAVSQPDLQIFHKKRRNGIKIPLERESLLSNSLFQGLREKHSLT